MPQQRVETEAPQGHVDINLLNYSGTLPIAKSELDPQEPETIYEIKIPPNAAIHHSEINLVDKDGKAHPQEKDQYSLINGSLAFHFRSALRSATSIQVKVDYFAPLDNRYPAAE